LDQLKQRHQIGTLATLNEEGDANARASWVKPMFADCWCMGATQLYTALWAVGNSKASLRVNFFVPGMKRF